MRYKIRRSIFDWIRWKFRLWVKGPIDRLRTSLSWFFFMRNNHWWDHAYLYLLIAKRLGEIEEKFQKEGHHLSHFSDARQMRLMREALTRLASGNYLETEYVAFHEKWKDWGMDFVEKNPKTGLGRLITRHKISGEETPPEYSEELRALTDREEAAKERDLERVATIFKKYSGGWWD